MSLQTTLGAMRVSTPVPRRRGAKHISAGTTLRSVMASLTCWWKRMGSRQQSYNLDELDDHILQDIGLTRAAFRCQAEKFTSETELTTIDSSSVRVFNSRRTDENAAQHVWFHCTPHPYGNPALVGSGASSNRSPSHLRRISGRDQG
jgi:uncharacterized protein YjiS (DUF1127 family)